MKLDVLKLPYTKAFEITENVSFDSETFERHIPLIDILDCKVSLKVQRFEEFIYVTINIVAKVILQCSYTLKNFESTIKGSDELHFSSSNEEDDDCIVYQGNSIELDKYIFNLLSASVKDCSAISHNLVLPNIFAGLVERYNSYLKPNTS